MVRILNRMRLLLIYIIIWIRFVYRDCRKKLFSYFFVLLFCVIKCVFMVIFKNLIDYS